MCKFCDELKELKEISRIIPLPQNIKEETKVRITQITTRKGQRKPCGIVDYKAYKLNYCPMCGKRVEE